MCYTALLIAGLDAVLNKIDAMASEEVSMHRRAFADRGVELLTISAATGAGIDAVLERLWSHLHPAARPTAHAAARGTTTKLTTKPTTRSE